MCQTGTSKCQRYCSAIAAVAYSICLLSIFMWAELLYFFMLQIDFSITAVVLFLWHVAEPMPGLIPFVFYCGSSQCVITSHSQSVEDSIPDAVLALKNLPKGFLYVETEHMQGCGLGLDVSVSRRSRDVSTSRSRLDENCQRLGLVSVSVARSLSESWASCCCRPYNTLVLLCECVIPCDGWSGHFCRLTLSLAQGSTAMVSCGRRIIS